MKRIPCVAIILENREGEILLLLRDNKSTINFPNQWTLIGGKVKDGETPEMAAHRELVEETGLKTELSLWKQYDREHPLFIADQYIYTGKVDASTDSLLVGAGQDLQFVSPSEIQYLKIGYGFKTLLHEYLLIRDGNLHVHHA